MANADDFCQFARLGQTVKIQKCLQSHSVDVNALNLYGESALSTATYNNQILCVEYLLANKADPKLRLSAGHTAIHIACRLANVPILHMLLSVRREETSTLLDDEHRQHFKDKHVFQCLKIKDSAKLTPIHWAATQESVSKRQKMFAYLDKRMPGVLDSRYNLNWFHSWAKAHPWVHDQQEFISPKPSLLHSTSTNQDEQASEITSLDITPKVSTNTYERTPRAPLLPTTNNPSKSRVPRIQIDQPLPPTPITSCKVTVTSIYHIPKRDSMPISSSKHLETHQSPDRSVNAFSPTHRARRVQVQPTIDFPPPPSDLDDVENDNTQHDYEDMSSPLSSKRPSHNLLFNIVPSVSSTPSSSQQSTKPIASSFGFDTSIEPRHLVDTTIHSNTDTYAQNDDPIDLQSVSSNDEDHDYESNRFDYLCKSTSTLGIASPHAHTYYV